MPPHLIRLQLRLLAVLLLVLSGLFTATNTVKAQVSQIGPVEARTVANALNDLDS